MKRIITIIIIIILSLVGIATYTYFQNKKESNLPKHQVENKNREFNSPEERREYIASLEASEEEINNHNIDQTLNSGGFEGIPVYGLRVLIDEVGIDNYIKIEESLILSINILKEIIDENSKMTLEEKRKYFNNKTKLIFDSYGLSKPEEFIDFITKFKKIDNHEIKGMKFNSEIVEMGNVLKLKAIITLSNEETISQNITLIKMINEKEYLIVWE